MILVSICTRFKSKASCIVINVIYHHHYPVGYFQTGWGKQLQLERYRNWFSMHNLCRYYYILTHGHSNSNKLGPRMELKESNIKDSYIQDNTHLINGWRAFRAHQNGNDRSRYWKNWLHVRLRNKELVSGRYRQNKPWWLWQCLDQGWKHQKYKETIMERWSYSITKEKGATYMANKSPYKSEQHKNLWKVSTTHTV